jgi:hypothetical protein
MSKSTIYYINQHGAESFALLERITHVEGTERTKDCTIHLDTGEIIQTQDDVYDLRNRIEIAYQLRGINQKP